jgi:hypothetical protein
MTKLTL